MRVLLVMFLVMQKVLSDYTMISTNVTLSSDTTYATDVTYDLAFSLNKFIPAGSFLLVLFNSHFPYPTSISSNCMVSKQSEIAPAATICSTLPRQSYPFYGIKFQGIFELDAVYTFLRIKVSIQYITQFDMINPIFQFSTAIQVQIKDQSQLILQAAQSPVSYRAVQMTGCSYTPGTQLTGQISKHIVKFTPYKYWDVTYIQLFSIKIPIWFNSFKLPNFGSTSLVCKGLQNTHITSLSCQPTSLQYDIITISNIIASYTTSGQIQIQIQSLRNPWSLYPFSGIVFQISLFGLVLQRCSDIYSQVTTPSPFTTFTLNISTNEILTTNSNVSLILLGTGPILWNRTQLLIQFNQFQNESNANFIQFVLTSPGTVLSQSQTSLTLYETVQLNNNPGYSFTVYQFNITTPISTKPYAITVKSLYTPAPGQSYAMNIGTKVFQNNPGQITYYNVRASDSTVNAISSYQIEFKIINRIGNFLLIRVVFPANFAIDNLTTCISNETTYISCEVNSTYITLQPRMLITPFQFYLVTINKVKNPPNEGVTTSFKIYTYDGSSPQYLVDKVESGLQMIIRSTNYSISSSVTYVNPKINALTAYQITIEDSLIRTVTDPKAYIEITFDPTQFSFLVPGNFSCIEFGQTSSQTPAIYNCRAVASNKIKIDNPMITSNILKIQISTIKNPSTVTNPNLFYNLKFFSDAVISQSSILSNGAYIPGQVKSCTTSFQPNLVHQLGQASFQIALQNQAAQSFNLLIGFYKNWPFQANSSVYPITGNSVTCYRISLTDSSMIQLECEISDMQQLLIRNAFSNPENSTDSVYKFMISNVLSPPTSFPSYTIGLSTGIQVMSSTNAYGKSQFGIYKLNDVGACVVSQLQSKNFTVAQLTFQKSSVYAGQSNKLLELHIIPTLDIGIGDELKIQFSQQIFDSEPNNITVNIEWNACFGQFTSNLVQITRSTLILSGFPAIPATCQLKAALSIPINPKVSGKITSTLTLSRQTQLYIKHSIQLDILINHSVDAAYGLSRNENTNTYIFNMLLKLYFELSAKSIVKIQFPSFVLDNSSCSFELNASANAMKMYGQSNCTVKTSTLIAVDLSEMNLARNFQVLQQIGMKFRFLMSQPVATLSSNTIEPFQQDKSFQKVSTSQPYAISIKIYYNEQSSPVFEYQLQITSIPIIIINSTDGQSNFTSTSFQQNKNNYLLIALAVGISFLLVIIVILAILICKFKILKRWTRKDWVYNSTSSLEFCDLS